MAGTVCNFATQLKFLAGYDDSLDVGITSSSFHFVICSSLAQIFASHAIGGVVGNILTALFAQASVAGFDGITVIPGGWLDHHYIQLAIHLADSSSGIGYSFVVTVSFPLSSFGAILTWFRPSYSGSCTISQVCG